MAVPRMGEFVWLTEVPREIRRLRGGAGPSYAQCYSAILNGVVEAKKNGGRYQVERRDIPALAAALGFSITSIAA